MSEFTADYVRRRISYDPETGFLTWKSKPARNRFDRTWNARYAGKNIVYKGQRGYVEFNFAGRVHTAHRIAWLIVHGEWPMHQIDHANGIRDDNRLCNLREATHSQNQANRKHPNKIGYRGVVKDKKRWTARIWAGGRKHLGTFGCPTLAALAYDRAARELNGEFATLNFPER